MFELGDDKEKNEEFNHFQPKKLSKNCYPETKTMVEVNLYLYPARVVEKRNKLEMVREKGRRTSCRL